MPIKIPTRLTTILFSEPKTGNPGLKAQVFYEGAEISPIHVQAGDTLELNADFEITLFDLILALFFNKKVTARENRNVKK